MAKKLLICDLDGTLLDTVEELSLPYSDKLNALLDEGIDFTIATGRDFENTKQALHNTRIQNPVILTNGAILAEYPSGDVLEYHTLPSETISKILDLSAQFGLETMVFASYDKKNNYPRFIKGRWVDVHNIRRLKLTDFEDYLTEPVISIQFMNDKKSLDTMYSATKNNPSIANNAYILFFEHAYIPGMYWLEYNPENASKEVMLASLIKRKGYTPSDIVVFGDNFNDMGMFQLAGTAVVVDNASEEIKKYADYIVPSNMDGGVLIFIEEHLKDFI